MMAHETPLHLLHVFSTLAVGGPQIRFAALANSLGRKYRHSIVAMDGNYDAAKIVGDNIPFSIEPMPVRKSRGLSLANIRRGRSLLHRLKPALLCTYNWGAVEWCLANWPLSVCPHIHLEDGFGPDEGAGRQHWRRMAMRRLLLRCCEKVIVPSRLLQDIAISRWKLPERDVVLLPNGVDCERFSRMPNGDLISSLGIGSEDLVVGTVAALRREKNLGRLLRVFSALPRDIPAKLVIVGGGPEQPMLAEMAKTLGISDRVVVVGPLKEPEEILRRFDVFALSSDTEQMPNSILEAMAASLPVLATNVGDVRHMVSRENMPFVFPVGNEAALRGGLLKLLIEPQLRSTLGKLNRDRVLAEYGLKRMVANYDALFANFAAARPD